MSQPQPDAPLDLDAIQARTEDATPGPWWADDTDILVGTPDDCDPNPTWIGESANPGTPDGGLTNATFIAAARTDVEQLLTRVRQLEAELVGMTDLRDRAITRQDQLRDRLDERTSDIADRALANAQLRAERDRYRTAWHSARTRATTTREHLDITELGRDRAIEAVEQLQAELATERAVAESNQRAAKLLAEDVQRLTAEATRKEREMTQILTERDAFHDMADRLAAAIAPIEVIGEHSSDNCPWENALDAPNPPTEPTLTGWAAGLADAGLTPYGGTLTLDADDAPFVRLHFAFTPDMPDPYREQFLTQLGRIILDEL
ncbi:hypothetical protein [Kitasatospora sp. NPDC056731]|uniref:hypothetical protein n=1 Tax=Kitasatospora sp. NPDC056731 TaxID=3155422 RepID=UPI0034282323